MDIVYKALADATRRDLLDRLKEKDGQTLSDLCEGLSMSRQSVTKHLKILEEANLVNVVWQGREKLHFLNPIPIREISRRWVSKYTKARADTLLDLKTQMEEIPMSAKPEFNYVTFIKAPREKIWEALTKSEFTEKYWFNSRVEGDFSKGSKYAFRVDDEKGKNRIALAGKVLKSNRPAELVYQFTCPTNDEIKQEDSTVQFLLEEAGEVTKLTVRHYNFEEGSKMFGMVSDGWPVVLSGLKTLLESGDKLNLSH